MTDILAQFAEEGRTYRRLGLGIEKMPPYKLEPWATAWRAGWREEDEAIAARPLPPPVAPVEEPQAICQIGNDEEIVICLGGKPSSPSFIVYRRRRT